jgi:hypothetical protein
MPVIANPITAPAELACADQPTKRPVTTAVFDVPAPEKMKSVRAREGQNPVVEWTMTDAAGAAINLATCLQGGEVKAVMRLREATAGCDVYIVDAESFDPAAGAVTAEIDTDRLGGPGIYLAEIAVMDGAGDDARPVFSNQFQLILERSLFGAGRADQGPPTHAEIRLHLRDSSPGENLLLDAVSFDDAELAACISRAVDYWNQALPPLEYDYTTHNFPFRYMWLDGICAGLFSLAAEWYSKNDLQYQAGGVAVNDMNKGPYYAKLSQQKWQEFKQAVQQRKIAANIEAGYGGVGSEYGWSAERSLRSGW